MQIAIEFITLSDLNMETQLLYTNYVICIVSFPVFLIITVIYLSSLSVQQNYDYYLLIKM